MGRGGGVGGWGGGGGGPPQRMGWVGKGDPADPRPAVAPRLPLARALWPVVVIWDSVVRRVLSCLPTQWPFSPDLFSVGAAAPSSGD